MKTQNKWKTLVTAALCLALCMVLPFITGGIPKIGNMLCPMHIPMLLCGFLCGPWYGLTVGIIAPLLRSLLFGAPPMFPIAFAMCFELASYGLFSGLFYKLLPKKLPNLYVSLIGAMLIGRFVWGAVRILIYSFGGANFGWAMFLSGAVTSAIPGIILQLVLIPAIMIALRKTKTPA